MRPYRLAKSKSHIIYNDAELNSREAIYVNIYQNFTVLAMKMHHYLRQWGLDVDKSHTFIMRMLCLSSCDAPAPVDRKDQATDMKVYQAQSDRPYASPTRRCAQRQATSSQPSMVHAS